MPFSPFATATARCWPRPTTRHCSCKTQRFRFSLPRTALTTLRCGTAPTAAPSRPTGCTSGISRVPQWCILSAAKLEKRSRSTSSVTRRATSRRKSNCPRSRKTSLASSPSRTDNWPRHQTGCAFPVLAMSWNPNRTTPRRRPRRITANCPLLSTVSSPRRTTWTGSSSRPRKVRRWTSTCTRADCVPRWIQ